MKVVTVTYTAFEAALVEGALAEQIRILCKKGKNLTDVEKAQKDGFKTALKNTNEEYYNFIMERYKEFI